MGSTATQPRSQQSPQEQRGQVPTKQNKTDHKNSKKHAQQPGNNNHGIKQESIVAKLTTKPKNQKSKEP